MTVTKQNLIHELIKKRLNTGNGCCRSFQDHLSYYLLSKIVKIRLSKTIVLSLALYGYEAWSLSVREDV
jgi:hypothetical protein